MAKFLVLSKKPYDFEDEKGKRIHGAKVSYISKRASIRDTECGHPPVIVNITDDSLVKKVQFLPGIYDLEFEQVAGKNNKPELYLADVQFISEVDLGILF